MEEAKVNRLPHLLSEYEPPRQGSTSSEEPSPRRAEPSPLTYEEYLSAFNALRDMITKGERARAQFR